MKNIRRYSAALKWIPRILMLAVIGFSAYVYLSYKKTLEGPARPQNTRPVRVVQEVEKLRYSHFDEGIRIYDVNARRNIRLKNNAQQLEDPEFIFYDKNQKEMIRITGKKCTITKDFNSITVIDDVVVKSQEGMSVQTHLLKYDYRLEQFSTNNPSTFHWKTLNGKSKGFVYTTENDTLILPDSPEIQYVNKTGENTVPILVTGARGAIDRRTGFAYFDENVHVTQGKDKIVADRIEVNFEPGGNQVDKITARGNVHMKFAKPQSVTAGATEKPAPDTPGRQAAPMSNVFTTEASTGKELDADYAEIFFYENGNTIRSFHSTGNCVFTMHTYGKEEKPVENRIIKGQVFDATFNLLGDMQLFQAAQDVSVHVQPLREARKEETAQTIYCKSLTAQFVPETGEAKEIYFNDGFKHQQQKRIVTSDKAVYYGALKKTDLIGNPEILDTSFIITADAMELFEETSGIHASGNVKSTFTKSEGKTPTTFPFSSPSNQPIYISADKMEWNSIKAEATYTGKAKLWQEKNVITAPVIVINDNEKTLSAFDKVHTIFYNQKNQNESEKKTAKGKGAGKGSRAEEQPQTQAAAAGIPAAQTKPAQPANKLLAGTETSGETGPISVDAGTMNYVEKDRIIHFEKDVKIVTSSARITGSKADFYLKEQTSELDHLYAQGKVQIQHEQMKGNGDTATFYAQEQKLVLDGMPKLSEPGRADIHGRMLTLFLTDGRILIDGQADGRATTTLEMQGSTVSSTPSKFEKPTDKNVPDASTKNGEPDKEL